MATGENKRITGSLILEDRYQTTIYDDILAITNATVSLLDPAGEIFTDKGNDTVTVTNSTISDNSETGAGLMFSMGSGDDSLDISNTTLNVNTFMGSGNDTVIVAGGIFSEVTINNQLSLGAGDDTLILKSVLDGSGNLVFGDGDDELVLDGGHLLTTGNITGLTNLTVTGNTGTLGTDLTLSGSTVTVTLNGNLNGTDLNKRISIADTTVTFKTANNVKTDVAYLLSNVIFDHVDAGTLEIAENSNWAFTAEDSTVTLRNAVLRHNLGGLTGNNTHWTLSDSDISDNTTGVILTGGALVFQNTGIKGNWDQGAIFSGANVSGADVSFSNNSANVMASATKFQSLDYIYEMIADSCISGGAILQNDTDTNLAEVSFSDNRVNASAYSTFGKGSGYCSKAIAMATASGGAIAMQNSSLDMTSAAFFRNNASSFASASGTSIASFTGLPCSAFSSANGGAIGAEKSEIKIQNANFSGNYVSAFATASTNTYSTAALSIASVKGEGGAIALISGDMTLTGASFDGNYVGTEVVAISSNGDWHSGAWEIASASATANASGGAIAHISGNAYLTDVTFSGNSVAAIASATGKGASDSITFVSAQASGGAILHTGGELILSNASFSENTAYACASYYSAQKSEIIAAGGALFAADSIVTMSNAVFAGNKASAATVTPAYSGSFVITQTGWKTDLAPCWGGAICLFDSILNYKVSAEETIENTGNNANLGGFIYLRNSQATFQVDGALIVGDSADFDSIAGQNATIIKTGTGTWTINSDVSNFSGYWNVNEGILKLARIVRYISLDNWTIGVNAEVQLSALDDTISMNVDKKIGTIDLGGGSDIINTGGYHLSDGLLKISKLTLTGGGRVSSEITNRTAGAGFDLILDDVTLDSIITGGSAADKITVTQSSTIGGVLNLGNGANTITANSGTETVFVKSVMLGTGADTLTFSSVVFQDSLTLGSGKNSFTAEDSAKISGAFSAGTGDDILSFNSVEFGNSADLGDGVNSLTATGNAKFSGTLNTGNGSDTLTFASVTFNKAVSLGDGNNKLTANTAIFNGDLTAGSGNDTINLKQDSELRGNIALGGGRNYIYVTQNLSITDGFTLDANGETHLIVYNKASLSSNTLNVYSPDNKNMATASYDWSDVEGLDKVRILVSSDATFETFEFTVELYNQSKEFTLNVSDNYFVQFQAQDEDGWTHRILADDEAPDQVSGFAMDGTTAVWDATHDNWGGNGVKKYNIQVAADANFKSLIGTYTSSENSYSFDSYADGNYFIRIQAEDYTGNKGAWSNIENFLIDNSAPTKPESVYGTASGDSISAVWHEATDSGSGVKEYKIEFSTTSTFSNIAHSATVAGTAYTAANLTDGTYYFRVAAIDNVNNMSAWSSAASAVVDTIGPDSVSGISVSQNAGVITLNWNTASDSGVGVKEYNIQYSTDMNFTSAAGSLSSGSTSCSISDLADGDYYFRIQAVDKNGNVGNWSNVATATVDGTAPTAPAGLLVVPGAYSATLSWNAASDALSGVKEYEYLISSDSNFSSIEFSGTTSALSQAISNIGYGSYYFKVRAIDNCGNVGNWSNAESFAIADATKPELTISGNPVNWTNQPVIISANASDSESGIKTLEYSTDNRTWKTGSAVSVNANGNLYFRATDNDGNVTVKSVSVTMIDTAAPALSISGNTDTVTNQNVLLSADCNDSESGIKSIQYSFDNRTWFTGSSVSVDENKTVYFKVTDNAGNVTEKSFAVSNIDKTAPLKPTASANITTVTNQNVTVSAAFSNDSVIREYSFDCNTWLTYTTGIVMENNGSVYFRGQDAAGNWSDVTTYQVSNIDRSGPDTPVLYASTSKLTNKNVTIWADYSLDCTLLYSYNQQTWYEYDDSGLTVSRNGNIYFKAADAIGNFSEVVCFQVSNIDKVAPVIPEGFVSRSSGNTVLLDWEDSSDNGVAGIKGYKIRYGTSSDLSGEGVFTAASEFDLTDLSCGTYYYQVKTEDNAGNSSEWSEIQTFEIASPLVQNLKGDRNGLSWDILPGAAGYVVEYSANDFKTVIAIETASNAVDAFALPQGAFKWRVRALESTEWAYGTGITGTGSSNAEVFASDTDGDMDLFFGSADGIWEAKYAAQHLGNDTWRGTQEKVLLAGKNKIADIFNGSDDANILVLTDDTNGDALFVDDIYTALGDQARFSQIDEIRAGAGDDIVDMTSQRYAYEGDGITIYGGSGNDTIWGGAESNTLFGDAGNDRLVGGSGDDVIVGGSGSDSMHGGGGNDIFTFGADWGKDTVKQLSSGSVTLWFESGSEDNWNSETLTYSDGVNTVTVTGTTDITLRFGAAESAVEGAFLDAASEKVFEDKNKGFIA